ncbi:DUF6172 family protein [Stenotrophomonas sp. MMGLT7]|uniref:DUF6172 family protein n=1 Tax=Stenotrophomonas sp. MMGLT7 TaxID=2901227 RepID=UPI001E4CAFCA|nr:DUF6172 family protein [Stenotrophomonas sp. MMGLT7]
MRKTYQLDIEGKNRDRLLEASKHDIRKYLRRERRKALPAGADFWDFDVRVGADATSAAVVDVAGLIPAVDALVAASHDRFYVEILSRPEKRRPRADAAAVEAQHGNED